MNYMQYHIYLINMCSSTYYWFNTAATNLKVHLNNNEFISNVHLIKNHYQIKMNQLVEVCCIDYPQYSHRFQIVYNFLSTKTKRRLITKVWVSENSSMDSIYHIYPSSRWLEREVYDLFGVMFNNHGDLRRILTDYGFEGYPLRKDFPVSGFMDLRFFSSNKKINQEKLMLIQLYRNSIFEYPWSPLK
jgi:NADH-quinone oxidoreductase subunit C